MKKIIIGLMCLGTLGTTVAESVYEEYITRKSNDLYQIDGKAIYIKTRFCYEYSYSEKVLFTYNPYGGYSQGKIMFKNGQTCDIEKIMK